jgi:hypothetical protein
MTDLAAVRARLEAAVLIVPNDYVRVYQEDIAAFLAAYDAQAARLAVVEQAIRDIGGGGAMTMSTPEMGLLGTERIDHSTGWCLRVTDYLASPYHQREGGSWAVQWIDGPRKGSSFSATTTWLYQCTRPVGIDAADAAGEERDG